MTSYRRFGVVGGGAWGTALAQLLAADGVPVRLWAREEEVVAAINGEHRNLLFLPSATLSPSLTATGDLSAVAACVPLLVAVPVPLLRTVRVRPSLRPWRMKSLGSRDHGNSSKNPGRFLLALLVNPHS